MAKVGATHEIDNDRSSKKMRVGGRVIKRELEDVEDKDPEV